MGLPRLLTEPASRSRKAEQKRLVLPSVFNSTGCSRDSRGRGGTTYLPHCQKHLRAFRPGHPLQLPHEPQRALCQRHHAFQSVGQAFQLPLLVALVPCPSPGHCRFLFKRVSQHSQVEVDFKVYRGARKGSVKLIY